MKQRCPYGSDDLKSFWGFHSVPIAEDLPDVKIITLSDAFVDDNSPDVISLPHVRVNNFIGRYTLDKSNQEFFIIDIENPNIIVCAPNFDDDIIKRLQNFVHCSKNFLLLVWENKIILQEMFFIMNNGIDMWNSTYPHTNNEDVINEIKRRAVWN